MLIHVPDHFSSYLKFDFRKFPARVTDRSSLVKIILGLVSGTLLLGLGSFELLTFIKAAENIKASFLTVELFAFIIILIGLGLIAGSIFSFNRYKHISFDGKNFTITYAPSFRVKHQITESLENYIGVRLRVLFIQTGIFNHTRYIIDLYHQDSDKIIPLYISTHDKDIRRIWEGYAKTLKMPALSIGDRGLVRREYTDLDKSLQELADCGKLPFIASGKFPAPETLDIEEKRNITIIRPIGIYWDIFSLLFLFIILSAIFVLLTSGVYLTILGLTIPLKYWIAGGILLFVAVYWLIQLFHAYQLEITPDSVAVIMTLFNSPRKKEAISVKKIENIELTYSPTMDRYSLAIISDERVITFGSRLPVSDLLWLKDFVIRKLVGN